MKDAAPRLHVRFNKVVHEWELWMLFKGSSSFLEAFSSLEAVEARARHIAKNMHKVGAL